MLTLNNRSRIRVILWYSVNESYFRIFIETIFWLYNNVARALLLRGEGKINIW
jgi:hypothetical protein